VNLSIFSIPDPRQIKDLAGVESAKTGKIHILYGSRRVSMQRAHQRLLRQKSFGRQS
jgi:hypothetical protein